MPSHLQLVSGHACTDTHADLTADGRADVAIEQSQWRIVGMRKAATCSMGPRALISALEPDEVFAIEWRLDASAVGALGFSLSRPVRQRAPETDSRSCWQPRTRIAALMAEIMPDLAFAPVAEDAAAEKAAFCYPVRPGVARMTGGGVLLAQLNPAGGLARLAAILAPYQLRALKLRFRPRILSPEQRDSLAMALHQSAGRLPDQVEAVAACWLAVPRGLSLKAEIETGLELDASGLRIASEALFGMGAHDRSGRAEKGLDLSDAWPAAAPWPDLLPDRHLRAPRFIDPCAPTAPCDAGLLIGRDDFNQDIFLGGAERAQHAYVIGATGTGKSTLLGQMILQDAAAGEGVILIDPHGDLARLVKSRLPAKRLADLVWADVSDPASAIGLNILEDTGSDPLVAREFIVNELIAFIKCVLYPGNPDAFGPVFEQYFRNTLLLLMTGSEQPSLSDFMRVLTDSKFRKGLLDRTIDRHVKEFWTGMALETSGDYSLANFVPYVSSKLTQFTGNAVTERMLAPDAPRLDVASVMRERKIALITLEKGKVGGFNAAFIGALIAIRIAQTAMARAAAPEAERTPCRLYVDEFQTLAGDSLATTLAESRKYGLSVTLANQSLSQSGGAQGGVGAAALANCANLIAFRVGAPDAAILTPWFIPEIDFVQLSRLPNYVAAVRLLEGSGIADPRLMHCRPL